MSKQAASGAGGDCRGGGRMRPGDKVNWLHEPRGGYGYSMNVAAVVVKIGPKRIQVRAAKRVNGEWHQVMRWVEVERLSPRSEAVPEVDGD